MATTVADYIQGNDISLDKDGFKITRAFLVSGVTGDADERMYNAITDAGIPDRGDAHPGASLGSYVAYNIRCQLKDEKANGIFLVFVDYGLINQNVVPDDDQTPVESVGSSVSDQETNLDVNGDPLVVEYNGDEQTGTVSIQYPNTILQYSRLETGSPLSKSLAYAGTINDATFKGCAAGTVLCTRIDGNGNSVTGYSVTYEFQYKPGGWTSTVAYQDANGKVPPDVAPGNGLETYDMYHEANFSLLSL